MTAAQLAAINSGITEGLVTTFSNKQNALSNNQLSAINSVANDRNTYVTFTDQTTTAYLWVGEVNTQTLVDAEIYDSTNSTWLKNIESITFGSAVTGIGANAFDHCGTLELVTFKDGLTSIGANAFDHCGSLVTVTFPKSLLVIDDFAF